MLDALYRLDLDIGFLVAREVYVRQDHESLRTIGDIEGAVETELLDAALLASSLVEGFGERDGAVVELIREM